MRHSANLQFWGYILIGKKTSRISFESRSERNNITRIIWNQIPNNSSTFYLALCKRQIKAVGRSKKMLYRSKNYSMKKVSILLPFF